MAKPKRTQKLARLRKEKEKLEQKIVEMQAQILELDEEIRKQENIEIIGAVRTANVSLEELSLLLDLAQAQNSDPQNSVADELENPPLKDQQVETIKEEEQ